MLVPKADPTPDLASAFGMTREQCRAWAAAQGFAPEAGDRLFINLHARRHATPEAMTDIGAPIRAAAQRTLDFTVPTPVNCHVSEDGTRKYAFRAAEASSSIGTNAGGGSGTGTATHAQLGQGYEAVVIPEVAAGSRAHTICISSQTGCAVGCRFCYTASLTRHRNLSAGELVGQVVAVQRDLRRHGLPSLTNVVFMGMGEPLLNYDAVVTALQILRDPSGPAFSRRRITVSTSGIVPRIRDLGQASDVVLAVSLNATTDQQRTAIMPINRKWPIAELLAAIRDYPLPRGGRVLIEYVMLDDVNDSTADAHRLVALLAGIPVTVNLLPLNAHDRTPYRPSPDHRVDAFQQVLWQAGMRVFRRRARGDDVAGACGQLGRSRRTHQATPSTQAA